MSYTVPGLSEDAGARVVELLQARLVAYLDLQLVLKHVHWNVTGPNFIGVHEMLDPQVLTVRGYSDDVAERIATMGHAPLGRSGDIVKIRDWDDYALERDTVSAHLGALSLVYTGVIEDNRKAIKELGELDPVSEDMMISQTGQLEQYQWFVRAHLEAPDGSINLGDSEEQAAASNR